MSPFSALIYVASDIYGCSPSAVHALVAIIGLLTLGTLLLLVAHRQTRAHYQVVIPPHLGTISATMWLFRPTSEMTVAQFDHWLGQQMFRISTDSNGRIVNRSEHQQPQTTQIFAHSGATRPTVEHG